MSLRCVRLDPDCGDVVDTLHMVDISRGGMGAICQRPFYPGQRIVLCLPQAEGNGRRNIYASVVRTRLTDETYHVGLEFDRTPAAAWCAVPTQIPLAA
jgi:c-di-GMP-binding flagellar brake protein YcgR